MAIAAVRDPRERASGTMRRSHRAGAGIGQEMAARIEDQVSVLSRKLRGPKMRLGGFPPMEPLCSTFASIASMRTREALQREIDVSLYGYEVMRHGDYLKGLHAPSAIYVLNFPATQGAGLVKAHPRLLGKLLDIYLGGDGSFEEANFARALTSIDLALYGRFVELVARCFDEAVRELCGASALGVARPTRFEQAPGTVRIAPDASDMFLIKLNFHVGDDKLGAGLDFVLPAATLEPLKGALIAAQRGSDPAHGLWADQMMSQVLAMPLKMCASISLGRFSLSEISGFREGNVLELPAGGLEHVALRAATSDGPVTLCTGKLGACDRQKAIRLSGPPDARFLAPLRRAMEAREPAE